MTLLQTKTKSKQTPLLKDNFIWAVVVPQLVEQSLKEK